jgi:3-oxochol-4-en-24-oyl-CoA dehydrogenase
VPIAFTEEQRGLQTAIRDWAARSRPIALSRRLEPGPPDRAASATEAERCWDDLGALGVFSIALPAEAGGAGGTVADLAAALEELARALAPGPVLPTLLAGLVLREAQDVPAAAALLPSVAAGRASVAAGLSAGRLTGTWQPGGTLRVTGETGPVLGAGSTSHLLLGTAT